MNIDDTSLISGISSMKIVDIKSGSVVVPYATSYAEGVATIAHGMGNSEIIPMVTGKPYYSWGGNGNFITAPWSSPDGRQAFEVRWDATNVYIVGIGSSVGSPVESITYNYTLYICVP